MASGAYYGFKENAASPDQTLRYYLLRLMLAPANALHAMLLKIEN
jgi:hypothetical protein